MKKFFTYLKSEPLCLTILYIPVHALFYFLSQLFDKNYRSIYCRFDDMIPFVPFFVVFYLIWFLFMLFAMVYPIFTGDRKLLWRETTITYLGMFLCLIISIVFPTTFPGREQLSNVSFKQFFRFAISIIYSADKPVNVFPSMHCLGAFSSHIVLSGSTLYKKHPWLHIISALLVVGICLSTMMIKQHSFLDFVASLIILAFVSVISYCFEPKYIRNQKK